MSFVQRLINALDAKIWQFVKAIISTNHDYPYHDFVTIENEAEDETINGVYIVGTANVNAHGDQSKRFVSKRANIWTNDGSNIVRLNDSKNVPIVLPMRAVFEPAEFLNFEKEFYTNIAVVYYTIKPTTSLSMYFEGVLPQEARDAE